MNKGEKNIQALNKDIDIALELLNMLKSSTHVQGDYKGVNYSEVKETRLLIHKILKRHEHREEEIE